jgi:transcriptional regulator with XRE-family HTH domain
MPRIAQRTTRKQKIQHMKQAKNLDKHVRARRADLRDAEVGRRVRSRRLECRLSQTELADRIGVTFQQVQKYEKGTNRISASRLQQMAAVLGVPVEFFFEGAPRASSQDVGASDVAPGFVANFLSTSEGVQLTRAFVRITDPKIRRRLISLVKVMAGEESE